MYGPRSTDVGLQGADLQQSRKGKFMKTIIIYRSKTGFTRQYAQWLAESLSCRAVSYERRKSVNLGEYDMLIFGGSFHAGMIGGLKWFKQETRDLKRAAKVVMATGAMPADAPEVAKALTANFSETERQEIRTFYLPGGLAYEKMGLMDKWMMKLFSKMMQQQAGKEGAGPEQKQMAEAIAHSYDISDKAFLEPIISYVKGYKIP